MYCLTLSHNKFSYFLWTFTLICFFITEILLMLLTHDSWRYGLEEVWKLVSSNMGNWISPWCLFSGYLTVLATWWVTCLSCLGQSLGAFTHRKRKFVNRFFTTSIKKGDTRTEPAVSGLNSPSPGQRIEVIWKQSLVSRNKWGIRRTRGVITTYSPLIDYCLTDHYRACLVLCWRVDVKKLTLWTGY